MLEEYLDKLIKNKNYNLTGMKINFIKENDEFYLINFEEQVESIGRPLNYKINKKTGENQDLFLPDDDNFDFLDSFENCNFVQIPEKFRGKYF